MKVPLMCYAEKEKLVVVANKNRTFVNYPVRPMCFIKKGFHGLTYNDSPIWEDTWVDLWKKEPIEISNIESFSRKELIQEVGLRIPQVTEIAYHLSGGKSKTVPITLEQGVKFISEKIQKPQIENPNNNNKKV